MNILLINHYAGSQRHGMEYRPNYLASEWIKLGHEVTIVAASFSHLRQKNPNFQEILHKEIIGGIHYIWIKTPPYEGNGIRRVINIIAFVFRLIMLRKKIIVDSQPEAVIASSTYPLDIFPATMIARKTGSKLVFEVHDLWPLSPIELGGMSPHHPFIAVMQAAENYAYREADWVVSLLPKADKHMCEHGMEPEKFMYIPNGIAIDEWKDNQDIPDEHRKLICNLKQKNQFIVGYTGGHGLANALSYFVDAAALLKSKPVSFVLVGHGNLKDYLMEKANQLQVDNIYFLPPVPKGSIPKLLSMMDVFYIGWAKNPLYRFGICPNKLMDYMMAGKPIIHAVDAGNDLVAESGCGISIPPEDPEAIAQAVVKLMNIRLEERLLMGKNGKKYVTVKHDYRVLAEEFINLLKKSPKKL